MSESECADEDVAVVAQASSGSEDSRAATVDKFGIPAVIKHAPLNAFTPIWQFIHQLAVPQPNLLKANQPFTHICALCAQKKRQSDTTATSWQACLMRQGSASNAKLHMLRQHEDHPFSIEEANRRKTQKLAKVESHDKRSASERQVPSKPKKQRTLEQAIAVSKDELRILATRWLLSSSLPHASTQNAELLYMLRRLSNQPDLVLPARETFYEFAEADFQRFINLTSEYLQEEFANARHIPFVALLHDLWTNASNVNVVGVTAIFIGSQWRLVSLSLLASPNQAGHAAGIVAAIVKEKIQKRYNIDIESYARFTVSDTTGSARNVSDHFDSTDQVDCLMHLLSLCLLYALGLKENTRQGGAITVTPGGKFSEGFHVIQLLRDLATFFTSPLRQGKLKQLKELYNLPRINTSIDAKTRVGYATTLLRRSVYNYYAFTKYFETAASTEQATWQKLSDEDWNLIVEMESITNQLAQFSLGEVQRSGVSSSYALLFRKLLGMTLEMKSFPCLVLERPDVLSSEFTQRRVSRDVSLFSANGKRCLARLKDQWLLRFPLHDDNEIKAMLLDPRIKSKASAIVDDADVLACVERELIQEHETIFNMIANSTPANEAPDVANRVGFSGSGLFRLEPDASTVISSLLDVEVPSFGDSSSHGEHARAALSAWEKWKSISVTWPCESNGGKYNLLKLYSSVDVLRWFRDHGEQGYPAIAVLARIYLAKPMSTASQERFFSLAGYVINDLRTSLDDNRAELLCLMKAN
ncbi:hypothetical protein PR003_g30195 [Phytophthora rubi]|uniref:HAT C-terminal dimerisation domain-containing protein n=1 Tax=Phytophthora rubi TaxID=129364 RepID=A0A6A4BGB9_9STRA|nr:hypothetical protein PR003_g30195 [Phytophthora rubi]